MKRYLTARSFASLLAIAICFCFSTLLVAQKGVARYHNASSYSGMVVFGDSLSDTGNLFAFTGLPPAPYFEGRFSNGRVWVEYLADSLGLEDGTVTNFAFGGATTGRDNINDIPNFVEFPGLQDQIDLFELGLNGSPADPDALYIVWAGANDFFLDEPSWQTIFTGISNTVTAVERLHDAGARHILVVNLPDLGLTPYGQTVDPWGLSLTSAIYNILLEASMAGLESSGIDTSRLNVSRTLRRMVANPNKFGLSNVTDAYLETGGDPDQFLFWDSVHPTTRGHAIFAEQAKRILRRRSRSGR